MAQRQLVSQRAVAYDTTYLEGDMLVPQADFQLLAPILVLLWPLAVIFPVLPSAHASIFPLRIRHILQYLAGFDDTLDLVDHCRTDTHYANSVSLVTRRERIVLTHFLCG